MVSPAGRRISMLWIKFDSYANAIVGIIAIRITIDSNVVITRAFIFFPTFTLDLQKILSSFLDYYSVFHSL